MKSWIIGNWKQNPETLNEVNDLLTAINRDVRQQKIDIVDSIELMVMPNNLHIQAVADNRHHKLHLGCQDICAENADTGAYTGDCSAAQMISMGVSWTLIGHSERRQYHQENADILLKKMYQAHKKQLGIIYCIGESLEEYENQSTLTILEKQLNVIVNAVKSTSDKKNFCRQLMVAYEPVWAIGTGKVPSLLEVEKVHQFIKKFLINIDENLEDVPVLYGGSVKPENAEQFAKSDWVNGALIGGASLEAEKFINIAQKFL